jgi:CubicO group peptidase (beta-lactamase class C family)
MTVRRLPFPLAALLFLLVAGPVPAQPAPLRGLDAYIEASMRDWRIPGLAIAVVKDDSVVYARGFGVRELGGRDAVDANTIFAIGSASKAFTSAAVSMLVDEGKVGWNDPATRHLPRLQLYDPYATRELNVRDLLSHRSGLARGDALWYATDYGRDEVLDRVRHLRPSWSFRAQFGYQNIMYLAAGQLVPATTGQSWDEFVASRIFAPLGMARSSTSTRQLEGQSNVATPHTEIDGSIRPIAWRNIDNIAPAGSINSSAREMAQWIRLNLNEGSYEGTRILSEESVRAVQTPETLVGLEGGWALMAPEANFFAYGLGWFLHDHQGRKLVHHGGNIDGMHALVAMVPEERLGLVVLSNMGSNHLSYALMHRVVDAYVGAPRTDWSARILAMRDSLFAAGREQARRMEEARVAGTSPSLALEAYAGEYEDPMYGVAGVSLEDGRLVLRRGGGFAGELEHWHYDTFRAVWADPGLGRTFVTFALSPAARAATLEIQGLATFHRKPEPAAAAATSR